jgi:hypothetical protein
MNKKFTHTLKREYESLEQEIDRLYFNLRLLECDHKLLVEYGYEINFAIDFHEIFLYAFPFSEYIERKKDIFSTKTIKEISNKQISRAFVFYGRESVKPPILLPPYEAELDSFLRSNILSSFLLADNQFERLKTFYDTIWTEINQNYRVKYAFDSFQKTGKIPRGYSYYLLYFLEKRFKNLLHALSGVVTNGYGVLGELINKNDPHVQFTSQRFSEYTELIKESLKDTESSKWFRLFYEIRGRFQPDDRDSQALNIIFRLNKEWMRRKIKKILFIISDAESMQKVLRRPREGDIPNFEEYGDGVIEINDIALQLPILRRLETFCIYLFYKAHTDNERPDRKLDVNYTTLQNIKDALVRVRKFRELKLVLDRLVEACPGCLTPGLDSNCELKELCKNAIEIIKYNKNVINKLEDLRLALKGIPLFKKMIEPKLVMQHYRSGVKSIVDFLIKGHQNFKKKAEFHESNIVKKFEQEQTKTAMTLVNFLSMIEPKTSEFQFQREFHSLISTKYRLKFRNENILKIFNYLEENIDKERNLKKTFEGIIELIKLTIDESIQNEKLLLLAALFLCYDKYSDSYRICQEVTNRNTSQSEYSELIELKEFFYLKILSRYRYLKKIKMWYYFDTLVKQIDDAIKKYCSDARFYHLKGRIMGVFLQDASQADRDKHNSITWDGVIDSYKKAYKYQMLSAEKDIKLYTVIMNNWAWYYNCREIGNDLIKAEKIIQKLGKIFSEGKWDPDIFHTYGVIILKICMNLKEKNSSDWRSFGEKSKLYLSQCVTKAELLGYSYNEIEYFRQPLKQIEEVLNN